MKQTNIINKKNGFLIALCISLLISVSNYSWIQIDNQPQPVIDEYVEKIYNLADGLTEKELKDYPRLFYWATLGPRPPSYQVMAAPMTLVFDRTVDTILIINAIFLVLLGLFTYKIAERTTTPSYAVLATLLVTTFPLTTELSKIARPHAIAPAVVALGIWLSLLCIQNRKASTAWLLAATFLFAFTIHPSTIYLLVGAIGVVGLLAVFNKNNKSLLPIELNLNHSYFLKGLLPAFSLCAIIIGGWLYIKWEQYIGLKNTIAEFFAPAASFWELEKTMHFAISWPYTILLIITLSIIALNLIIRKTEITKTLNIIALFLILMFAAFHVTGSGIYWHTFAGSTSVIAVLCSAGLMMTCNYISEAAFNNNIKRLMLLTLPAFICLYAISNYLHTGWGINSDATTNCRLNNKICETNNIRSVKPLAGNWMVKEIIAEILKEDKCLNNGCNIAVISHRPRYYSDEVFTSGMVEHFEPETRVKSDNFYPQRKLSFRRIGLGPGGNLNWLTSDFAIFLTSENNQAITEPVMHYGATKTEAPVVSFILDNLMSENALYKKVFTAKLPNQQHVILVKKIQQISQQQGIEIINSLKLDDSIKTELKQATIQLESNIE